MWQVASKPCNVRTPGTVLKTRKVSTHQVWHTVKRIMTDKAKNHWFTVNAHVSSTDDSLAQFWIQVIWIVGWCCDKDMTPRYFKMGNVSYHLTLTFYVKSVSLLNLWCVSVSVPTLGIICSNVKPHGALSKGHIYHIFLPPKYREKTSSTTIHMGIQ